ncbi:hypothetical protein CCACVL1_02334, partial [Corchorus capsularis]
MKVCGRPGMMNRTYISGGNAKDYSQGE